MYSSTCAHLRHMCRLIHPESLILVTCDAWQKFSATFSSCRRVSAVWAATYGMNVGGRYVNCTSIPIDLYNPYMSPLRQVTTWTRTKRLDRLVPPLAGKLPTRDNHGASVCCRQDWDDQRGGTAPMAGWGKRGGCRKARLARRAYSGTSSGRCVRGETSLTRAMAWRYLCSHRPAASVVTKFSSCDQSAY
jgi:hypothetical protein